MRRLLPLLLSAILVLVLAPAAQARDMLSSGDRGADVATLRSQLGKLGYLPTRGGDQYGSDVAAGVMAYQKVRGLERDGVAGPSTRKALRRSAQASSRPGVARRASGRRIEVDLSQQVARLIVDNRVTRTISVSSGRPGYDTPAGSFRVFRKERNSWSIPYKVNLPWASYFVGGVAFHGYSDVPAYAASHGCVRVPLAFAPEVYEFAGMNTRVDVLS